MDASSVVTCKALSLDWVAQRIGVSRGAVKARAQVLGIQRKVHKREPWTDRQLAYLRKHYADMRAEDIAKKVRHTIGSVWRTASKLGLKKSPEFLAQWGHLVASTEGAKANQFAKGHVSHNKGKSIEEFMRSRLAVASVMSRWVVCPTRRLWSRRDCIFIPSAALRSSLNGD